MTKRERVFINVVNDYYHQSGRHELPWRQTTDPYKILVSELMLQQTQVVRVLPKFNAFLKQFPTIKALATAPLGVVLEAWQGLGYNRRAKLLHDCAQTVVADYKGVLPTDKEQLLALPGIGPYTAGAIMAFAYNEPVVMIETNIRTVFLHHFFSTQDQVSDTEILPLIEKTLDQAQPRDWYAALMDYGSYLKQTVGNNITKSRHYQKQSPFRGSLREVRGAILRALSGKRSVTTASLRSVLVSFDTKRFFDALHALEAEGLIVKQGRGYALPGINQPHRGKHTSH